MRNKVVNPFKTVIFILLAISMGLTTAPLTGQNNNTGNDNGDNKDSEVKLSAGVARDERFSVDNLYFFRRYAPSGRGELLEVTFDINSNVELDIPLKLFVIGFYERDRTDEGHRRFIDYPVWRERDFEKESNKITFFDSIPAIEHEKVDQWNAERRGEEKKEEENDKMKRWRKTDYQQFLDYVLYINNNPEEGIDFKLQGLKNTQQVVHRKDAYNIVEEPLKTTVFAQLYSRFKTNRIFFNRLGLILYDTEQEKIVYRQFISFPDNYFGVQ